MGTIQPSVRLHSCADHGFDFGGTWTRPPGRRSLPHRFPVIIWTVCCPPSSFISAMTSFAPSLANVRAVARPIPDAPPVTRAIFPSKRPGILKPPVHIDSLALSSARLPRLPPPIPIRPFTCRYTFGGFEVLPGVVRHGEQCRLSHAIWDAQDCCRFLLVSQMEGCPG